MLSLDYFLHDRLDDLLYQIRVSAIGQYFEPYSTVHIPVMALVFSSAAGEFEEELIRLIREGKLPARIDSHRKTLNRLVSSSRSQVLRDLLLEGEHYQRNLKVFITQDFFEKVKQENRKEKRNVQQMD